MNTTEKTVANYTDYEDLGRLLMEKVAAQTGDDTLYKIAARPNPVDVYWGALTRGAKGLWKHRSAAALRFGGKGLQWAVNNPFKATAVGAGMYGAGKALFGGSNNQYQPGYGARYQ